MVLQRDSIFFHLSWIFEMATGHILPGYGDPVSQLRRVRSAGCYPLDSFSLYERKRAAELSKREFEQIRENARRMWSTNSPRETTYDSFFKDKDVMEITHTRPTSSYRHNNPHPPQWVSLSLPFSFFSLVCLNFFLCNISIYFW